MSSFFIDRPIFAIVIAIFICLGGLLAMPFLAVAQYPIIAPPSILITATYPGATPEQLYVSTTRLIEEQLNGAAGILSFESTSDTSGQVQILAYFEPGSDSNMNAVKIQNRIKRVEARLPRAVMEEGILIDEASTAVLQIITLQSTDGSLDEIALGDYMIRNIFGEIRRIQGVGLATMFSTERALRVWLDPDKLIGYGLSTEDVTRAIQAQNAQVASGAIGEEPSRKSQPVLAMIVVKGRLASPEEFGAILLRSNPDGSTVRLRDVARVEVAGMSYRFSTRLNGETVAGLTVYLSPTANALATAHAVEAKMEELAKFFPPNIKYAIPYNITPVIEAGIKKVLTTLGEAMILVFLVMFLFLQSVRYTFIPAVVVPVSLIGSCMALLAFGLPISLLSLFAMVLAIGILTDDAIVVVENVERIMSEEGLPPREAARKAMGQITGAIIGITLVLMSVFIPMAFFPGSVGIIYRQFSVTMVAAIGISAFLSLSLTPALCAKLLKPVEAGHHRAKKGAFGWFNRRIESTKASYSGLIGWTLLRTGRSMLIYIAVVSCVLWAFARLPTGFLPIDDLGFIMVDVEAPPDASFNRTMQAVKHVEEDLLNRKGIAQVTFLTGFSFLGQGKNTAQAFVTLKPWSERGPNESAAAIVADINKAMEHFRDAEITALQPPPIDNLGVTSGFSFRLQDRGQKGHEALMAAKDQLLATAKESPVLKDVYVEGLPPAPRAELVIDRQKAAALGVTFQDINHTISTQLGSNYVNDFPNRGRMQRVIVQADRAGRMQASDTIAFSVKNSRGEVVPFSSFASIEWDVGPTQLVGFNYYPSVRVTGSAQPGYSTGDAIAEMERIAATLPHGFGFDWTGQSYQEKLAGSQASFLLALSALVVFLLLAALYESWSIPLSVLLTVPLGMLGSVFAATLRDLPNNVWFTIALITIIGLASKDAILIVEFAKTLRAQGKSLIDSAVEAAFIRFRPIVMTGFAFIFGVAPMVVATGAASKSQHELGTAVVGGMIAVVVLALLMVPTFFVVIQKLFTRGGKDDGRRELTGAPATVVDTLQPH